MKTILAVYFVLGLMMLMFTATSYEFMPGTPWWRKVFSVIFTVLLWPVLIGVIIVSQ